MQIDDLTYTVRIGDSEALWPDAVSGIPSLTIFLKTIYAVPALDLVLHDQYSHIGKDFDLTDGQLIKISINKGNGNPETYAFRVSKVTPLGEGMVRIFAWGDEIKWFVQTTSACYTGNSSEVVSKLAEECGLKAEVDETSDKQKWLGFRQKRYVFGRRVASHGYADDSSIMQLSFAPGSLRYRDINRVLDSAPSAFFELNPGGSRAAPSYLLLNSRPLSQSGQANLRGGYASTMSEANAQTGDTSSVYNKVQVPANLQPAVNSYVAANAGPGLMRQGRAHSDNTHDNYAKAHYQNSRGLLMWNQRLRMLVPQQTRLYPLDCVSAFPGAAVLANTGQPGPAVYDGKYLLDDRVIQIRGSTYMEMITVRRPGTQT